MRLKLLLLSNIMAFCFKCWPQIQWSMETVETTHLKSIKKGTSVRDIKNCEVCAEWPCQASAPRVVGSGPRAACGGRLGCGGVSTAPLLLTRPRSLTEEGCAAGSACAS